MQELLRALCDWLSTAPALAGAGPWQVEELAPLPGAAGLFAGGARVLQRRGDLLGRVWERCRADFVLRLVRPHGADTGTADAACLLELQRWVADQCAAGQAPVFGNADTGHERLYTEGGAVERVNDEGTAVWAMTLRAEYTMLYEGGKT